MNAPNSQDPWDWLGDQLQSFINAWDEWQPEAPPPTLQYFVQGGEQSSDDDEGAGGDFKDATSDFAGSTELRRALLVELIKADIEYRLQAQIDQPLEKYHAEFPELTQLPAELIYEDYRLRRNCQHDVSAEDYCERFSQQAEDVRRLMGLDLPEASMTLHAQEKAPVFQPGDVIAEEFRLLALLGEGSFARVYLAQQESLGRMVALKVSANRGNEAQTLVRLDHANIIRVHDLKDVPDEGMRLLYMEYAPGGTLHDVVARVRERSTSGPNANSSNANSSHANSSNATNANGAILADVVSDSLQHRGIEPTFAPHLKSQTWAQTVCEIGLQLANALQHAHAEGVLHRDIKPANVLLSASARPKLADFNTSFNSQLSGSAPAAYFGGSLAYMSPEQLRAYNLRCPEQPDSLDQRSDLYSLAVVLWELLHGQRPFHDDDPTGDWAELLGKMTERREAGAPRGVSGGDPLSRELQRVLSKCLSPHCDDRCATGEEMARELQLCLNPHARKLVRGEPKRWQQIVLKWPTTAILATVLLPNLLAGILNLIFNWSWIDEHASYALQSFEAVQLIINLVAFPLGMLLVARLFSPVARALKRRHTVAPPTTTALAEARRLSLRIGVYGTWVGVALWAIAAILYPILIHLWVGEFPRDGYLIFIADLIACGLIAGSYPFFLASLLATRAFYPALLDFADLPANEAAELQSLGRNTGVYLLISAGVPMLALLVSTPLVFAGQKLYQGAMVGLVISGLIGLFAAWKAHLVIQKDLDALCYAVSPITPP